MKRNCLICVLCMYLLLVICGCNKDKKAFYQDSSDEFLVTIKESYNDGLVEDSLFIFKETKKEAKVREFGFYKNGFRSSIWNYNTDSGVVTINWGRYVDKDLPFETTTFLNIDSIIHGDNFTKIEFILNNEKINLTITINGTIKDSLPKVNYIRLIKKDLEAKGARLVSSDTHALSNKTRVVNINNIIVKRKDGYYRYVKSAYAYINKDLIELSVVSNKSNSFHAKELFDVVLTDLVFKKERVYNPYRSIEEYPVASASL